jgi:beta-galactosidase/beta-glucuronidase
MKKVFRASICVLVLAIVGVMAIAGKKIYDFTRPIETFAITTPWTDQVDPDLPLPEYPRPQLRRDDWQNLNGRWQYAITHEAAPRPESFSKEIIVPFAIESLLSGVQGALSPEERLWYRRFFDAPSPKRGQRLLLHFGAVDWEAEVWLNGASLGVHRGGYDPFSFDVTDFLKPGGRQELVVAVRDPTNLGPGAYGKQHLVPHGIRYTAVSGIWQTVWLETVPASRVEKLVSRTNVSAAEVALYVKTQNAQAQDEVELTVVAAGEIVDVQRVTLESDAAVLRFAPDHLRLWSPDDPFLYDVQVRLLRGDQQVDFVRSYFGAREVAAAEDSDGVTRLVLNGQPVFHLGLLDQGWWPDGLYTAPTDAALAFDIEATRRMGFNTIRKHVKVEPARWYWHADRLGLLVWQDMPTGDGGANRFGQVLRQASDVVSTQISGDPWRELDRSPESAALFRKELAAMMTHLEPFTSIVAWVPFNEAWGQFDTDAILSRVSRKDPSRLVNGPSGWFDTGTGDMLDLHPYNRESAFVEQLPSGRALVYGEFGGLALPLEDHLSVPEGWGYAGFTSNTEFEVAYSELMTLIESLVPRGLAGAIYTQTTDVESEINGLLTYDRREFKVWPEKLAKMHERVISSGATALDEK